MKTDVTKELLLQLKNTNRLVAVLELEFAPLTTNLERVDLMYKLLREFRLLTNIELDKKNDHLAVEFRRKGNNMFKIKKSKEALDYYTQSVAYSENNSDSLALAYANRSAVLFEQEMYHECLKDIERALFESNYPEKLLPKLLARKLKATEQQSSQKPYYYYEPIPTIPGFDRNALYKSASNALEVKYTEELGRHIVATRDLAIGDVVVVEKAYAHMLVDELYTHCHECLELCYNLVPCPNCPQVLYCSDTCKEVAYESYHQYECGILGAAADRNLNKNDLVSLKIALKARHDYEHVNLAEYKLEETEIYRSDRYKELHNLVDNSNQQVSGEMFNRAVKAAILYHLIKHHSKFFDIAVDSMDLKRKFKEIVLLQLHTACYNFHEILEFTHNETRVYMPEQIGYGAFPFLSLFNRSCYSNVVYEAHGSTMVVRAVLSIRKGEQCTTNYGFNQSSMEKAIRQTNLMLEYFFSCNCVTCENNWLLYDNLPNVGQNVSCLFHLKLWNGNRETAKDMVDEILDKLKKLESSKPCKGFYDMQELYKQCLGLFGNLREPLK